MLIRKFNLDEFEPMGECRYQMLFPWQGVAQTPFWSSWNHLKPGEKTKKHQHHEIEVYLIAQGRGVFGGDRESLEVGPGDVLYMPPFNDHVITNTSAEEDLLFLSIFWEDMKALGDLPAEWAGTASDAANTALIAVSGGPGPSRAAEVHARYLRMRGVDVRLVPIAESPGEVQDLLARLQAAGKVEARDGRLWFPLSSCGERLKAYHLAASMGPRIRSVAERAVAEGAEGQAVPLTGPDGQPSPELKKLPAWLAATRDLPARAAQFFGPGESFQFAVLYPALLLALDPEARLPETLVAVEDGAATTVAIQGLESELAGWQDWLAELDAHLQGEYGGTVPATGFYTAEQRRFYKRLLELAREAAEAYEAGSFSLSRAARVLRDLVWEARGFDAEEDAWIGVPDRSSERRTSIALGLVAAKILAMISAPLLPDFASRLARALGDEATAAKWVEVPDWVAAGSRTEGLGEVLSVVEAA
ncbi:MAG TPA: cupin domain-containing protein [Thermoanaerobaculia bacterium]|nr:cupin domain-containing protein [Thermoanaerobaculia bacterium]